MRYFVRYCIGGWREVSRAGYETALHYLSRVEEGQVTHPLCVAVCAVEDQPVEIAA